MIPLVSFILKTTTGARGTRDLKKEDTMATTDFRDINRSLGNNITVSPAYSMLDGHLTAYNVMWFDSFIGSSDSLDGAYAIADDLAHTIAENEANNSDVVAALSACMLGGMSDVKTDLYDTARRDLGHGIIAEPLLDASGSAVACYQLVCDGIVYMHCPDLDACERVVAKLA